MASPPPCLVLFSSGSNAQNQLSHSQQEDSHVFLPCVSASSSSTTELNVSSFPPPGTRSIVQLAFGANHTTCLLERSGGDREVWGCGDGERGQLGMEEKEHDEEEGGEGGFRRLKLPPFPPELMVGLDSGEGGYDYQPIKIAASWTTTFIAFSSILRSKSSSTSSSSSLPSPPPDLLLAMGTNDFAELGNGRRGRSDGEEKFSWHVFRDERTVDLVSGPRHLLLLLLGKVNERSNQQRLVGWGAARHGQLSSSPLSTLPPLVSSSANGSTPPPPAVVLVPTPLLLLPSSPSLALGAVPQLALGLHHTLILNHTFNPSCSQLQILGRSTNPATQISLPSLHDASCSPPPSSNILQIAATWSSSILLLSTSTTTTTTESLPSILSYSKSKSSSSTKQPTLLTLPPNATSPTLRAGSEHVLVSLWIPQEKEGVKEVWGWGWNEHGNMGDGGTENWEEKEGLRRVWPSSSFSSSSSSKEEVERRGGQVVECWAGNGTSWVLVERS
ncbi:regulator of chromosome condensation 1/beta-lactamase-inhibitor protein II [Mrakia frigida]|uniref:RCC1-like domain-containing protein n=1 Tax=Mrakia frigida TaxID=29902 RepID=UPI003FCBF5DB